LILHGLGAAEHGTNPRHSPHRPAAPTAVLWPPGMAGVEWGVRWGEIARDGVTRLASGLPGPCDRRRPPTPRPASSGASQAPQCDGMGCGAKRVCPFHTIPSLFLSPGRRWAYDRAGALGMGSVSPATSRGYRLGAPLRWGRRCQCS